MTPNGTRLLLLIDNDPAQRRQLAALAGRVGWRTVFAADGETGIATLGTPDGMMLDAVLLDAATCPLPHAPGEGSIAEIRARRPRLPLLVLTAEADVETAVAAMRAGASDFLVKPVAPERLLAALEATVADAGRAGELRPLTEKISTPLGFAEIVGSAPEFRAALAVAAKAARARVPVLVEGEGGAGKETVARAIHAASPRAKKPWIAVNCAAASPQALESLLFGHERGAFAGAFDRRRGRLIEADGGTLFLDEVAALPPPAQARLMTLLDSGEVHPIGSRAFRQVDVRVIAASDTRLAEAVAAGRFREDLFFRLTTVQLTLPPLRDRAGDVALLARHLLQRIARQPGMRELGISEDALALLTAYDWPGNVRQLHNALFRAAVLCDGDALTRADFPELATRLLPPRPWPAERAAPTPQAGGAGGVALYTADGHLRPLEAIEADVIRLAIGHYRGRMTEVARRLGIGRSTLYRKLAELGIGEAA